MLNKAFGMSIGYSAGRIIVGREGTSLAGIGIPVRGPWPRLYVGSS